MCLSNERAWKTISFDRGLCWKLRIRRLGEYKNNISHRGNTGIAHYKINMRFINSVMDISRGKPARLQEFSICHGSDIAVGAAVRPNITVAALILCGRTNPFLI